MFISFKKFACVSVFSSICSIGGLAQAETLTCLFFTSSGQPAYDQSLGKGFQYDSKKSTVRRIDKNNKLSEDTVRVKTKRAKNFSTHTFRLMINGTRVKFSMRTYNSGSCSGAARASRFYPIDMSGKLQ